MDIMCGIDASDKSLVCAIGVGMGDPKIETVLNNKDDRKKLYTRLKKMAKAEKSSRVLVAYEACGLGYGMSDEMKEVGIDCRILSPGQMKRSIRDKKFKTDAADAQSIYYELRAHVMAGNPLPEVWQKPKKLREDLELVRYRIDLGSEIGRMKTQTRSLLKKHDINAPKGEALWSEAGRTGLDDQLVNPSVRSVLDSMLRRLEYLVDEKKRLDKYLATLAKDPDYKLVVDALYEIQGVGILTALAFTLELGDMSRFSNRKQLGSYLGLVPMSYETGQATDRKGHITRTGPSRLRKLLNQAAWVWTGSGGPGEEIYTSICERNPKKNKIAIVACMRRLGIAMWHVALKAQRAMQSAEQKVA